MYIVRHETPKDYYQIAQLHYRAFQSWKPEKGYFAEPLLVDMLRHSPHYNPEIALVALDGEKIIGHVMLTPERFILQGTVVWGVILAPIGIDPDYQKKGVGHKLMECAEKCAKEMGYDFSLLCGHPEYYPKFGYVMNTFAMGGTLVSGSPVKASTSSERPVEINDGQLIERWIKRLNRDDEFSMIPTDAMMNYVSHRQDVTSSMILLDGKVIGYVKYRVKESLECLLLGAKEGHLKDLIDYMLTKEKDLMLPWPVEKTRSLCGEGYTYCNKVVSYDAFMIKPLTAKVEAYTSYVTNHQEKLGVITFTGPFEID